MIGGFQTSLDMLHDGEKLEANLYHQEEFQVPKMEVLNLIRPFWGWVYPYISLTYSLYR